MIVRKGSCKAHVTVLAAVCIFGVRAAAGAIIYVDENATDSTHDGTTWCKAYLDLYDALSAASSSDTIQMANGTYLPDTSGLSDTREATFTLVSGVTIEGGYAGCGAPTPGDRDVCKYETILSGDLNQNDVGSPTHSSRSDNSYHVVHYTDPDAVNVEVNGVTITGGNADGTGPAQSQGGGVQIRCPGSCSNGDPCDDDGDCSGTCNLSSPAKCIPGGPTFRNCTILANYASNHGAINDHGLTSEFDSCTFKDNIAGVKGAGLLVQSGSPTVTDCIFIGNDAAITSDGEGGGAWTGHDDDDTCDEGASGSHATFTDCVFEDNFAYGGGGLWTAAGASVTIEGTGCRFEANSAGLGGALYTNGSPTTVSDCTFEANEAIAFGGAVYNKNTHSPASTVCFEDCDFIDNFCTVIFGDGTAVYTLFVPTEFERCIFEGNHHINEFLGMGTVYLYGVTHTITNTRITDNGPIYRAGGILLDGGSHVTVTGCTIAGNTGGGGGAIRMRASGTPTATVTNSILWGNTSPQIHIDGGGSSTVTYTDIQGGHSGTGNIDSDPLFTSDYDNVHLCADSPCIDAGDNSAVVGSYDLDGKARKVDDPDTTDTGSGTAPIVDMGAYEFDPEGGSCCVDADCDSGEVCCVSECTTGDCCVTDDCDTGEVCCGNDCNAVNDCCADSDCGSGEVCCTNTCETGACCADSDCCSPEPYCASNSCVECSDDDHCDGDTPLCVSNSCVECADDGDCGGSTPKCETGSGTCVQCLDPADCGNLGRFCFYTCPSNVCKLVCTYTE